MIKSPIISQQPFVPHLFEALDPSEQSMMDPSEYAEYVEWFEQCKDATFERIVYLSDGLRVVGVISRPRDIAGAQQRYPVIIYNHGGAGESGKVTVRELYKKIYPFVKLGYAVVASQYRGNDGSEGKDEVGGGDVDDVINLYPVIQSLSYADCENIFMVGFSRGAINTYRALQKNLLPIKACAVMSGLSDLFLFEKLRPDMLPLLEHFIPNYHANRVAELTKRSAVCWAQDILVPVLLLHGSADSVVDVSSSEHMARKLAEYNKHYALIIYTGAEHSLDMYRDQATAEIHKWFLRYT